MIQTSLQISDAICPDCDKVITRTESVKYTEFGFVHLKCFENPKLSASALLPEVTKFQPARPPLKMSNEAKRRANK